MVQNEGDSIFEKKYLEFANSQYQLIIKQLSEPSDHYAIIIFNTKPTQLHSVDIWVFDTVRENILIEQDKDMTCLSLKALIKEYFNEYIALMQQYNEISEPNQAIINKLLFEEQEKQKQIDIQKDFDNGMSIKDLCNKYNVSRPTLNKYGIQKKRKHQQTIPVELLTEIQADFKAGMSIKGLCDKYNVSQPTLNKYGIQKKQTKKQRQTKITTELLTKIQHDLRMGKSLKEVCEIYEVSRATLHNYGIKKKI